MRINLNPTSERGASRDAVNRPRETLGDSHLISSDPRSRFGLVCDLLCCRGNTHALRTDRPEPSSHEPDARARGPTAALPSLARRVSVACVQHQCKPLKADH